MLELVRAGVDHHNGTCPMPARAILLNPGNHALFGWDELWGIPVLADERVKPERFRIDCDGSAFGIEEELADAIATDAPADPLVIPAGPAREHEPTAAARAQSRPRRSSSAAARRS